MSNVKVQKSQRMSYRVNETDAVYANRYAGNDYAQVTFREKTGGLRLNNIERDMTRAEVQAALELFDAILADWPEE